MTRPSLFSLSLLGAVALAGCSDLPAAPETAPATELAAAPDVRNPKASPKKGSDPIAQIAIDRGLTELVGALSYVDSELGTELVDLFMNGTNQHTVFAPTDAAFEDLYGLLTVVLGQPIDEITDLPPQVVLDVLLYHVSPGRRAANSVLPSNGMRTMPTLLGESFAVRPDGTIEDGLTALGVRDDASIVEPNLPASNGIIHLVNQVIVPPSVVAALTN